MREANLLPKNNSQDTATGETVSRNSRLRYPAELLGDTDQDGGSESNNSILFRLIKTAQVALQLESRRIDRQSWSTRHFLGQVYLAPSRTQ